MQQTPSLTDGESRQWEHSLHRTVGEGGWAVLEAGAGGGEASVVWQRDRLVKKQLKMFKNMFSGLKSWLSS